MRIHDHRDAAVGRTEGPPISARAALEGGCATCRTSACCWYVPVQQVRVHHYTDVDHLVRCAGFDRIEVGMHAAGGIVVYYRAPCRHLGPSGRGCGVYGTPLMPQTCRNTSPHDCWFRANVPESTESFVRLDEPRMRAVAELYRFDLSRAVTRHPSWPEVLATVRAVDEAEREGRQAALPPSGEPPGEIVFPWERGGDEPETRADLGWDEAIASPCDGCRAPCCTHLVFDVARPRSLEQLDRVRYLLQFPGTEIGLRDADTWLLVIRSRCRHLTPAGRCGLFGDPRRPRWCTDYNEWTCNYPDRYESVAAGDILRLRHDQFLEVTALYEFAPDGQATAAPPTLAEVAQRLASAAPRGPGAARGRA